MRHSRLKAWNERLERKLAEEHGEESQIDCEKIHERHFFEVALPRTTTGRRHNLGTFAPLLLLTTLHLLIPRGQACWRLGFVIRYNAQRPVLLEAGALCPDCPEMNGALPKV